MIIIIIATLLADIKIQNKIIFELDKKVESMVVTFFGILPLRGFWVKQHLEDEYIGIKLLFGLFGLILAFWTFVILILVDFSIQLLSSVEDSAVPNYLYLLNSLPVQIILGIIVSILTILLVIKYSPLFEGYNIEENFSNMKHDLIDAMEMTDQDGIRYRLLIIWGLLFFNGIAAGIIYTFVYFIPVFVIYFLLFFIISNFITEFPLVLLLSALLSWIAGCLYVTSRKLDLKEPEVKEKPVIQRFSRRDVEILSSDEDPIICNNCRSFIPADSTKCPVCSEVIDQ